MAVAKITTISKHEGLSTDTKPTTEPAGSLFWEHDTRKEFMFDGTSWNERTNGELWL